MEAVSFLKQYGLTPFPYPFNREIHNVEVMYDGLCSLKYVMFEEKRLYFGNQMSDDNIKHLVSALINEQNVNSPHRYQTGSFKVEDGDILFDIGAAEGIFASMLLIK